MLTDPATRKHNESMFEIKTILADKSLSKEVLDVIHTLWEHIDSQDKLKISTKRNYLRFVRSVFRKVPIHPSKWISNTIIEIMN